MNPETAGEKFQQLVAIMARLRAPGGCPWDREQTFDSIKPFTIEETYEVLDAIEHRDWGELTQELGDFILQAVFYAQMASEQGLFRIEDSLDAINQKLVRRHPHVFGEESAASADEVLSIWGRVKDAEPKAERKRTTGLLGGVPRALPASVPVVRLEHDEDAVPQLDGEPTIAGPDVTLVTRSVAQDDLALPGGPHRIEAYLRTAQLADEGVAAAPGSAPGIEAVTRVLGRQGTTATTVQLSVTRAPAVTASPAGG